MRESADREQRQDRNSSRVSVARVSSSGPKRVLGSLQWKCTTLKKLHNDYNKVLKKIDSRLWVKKKSAAHERLNTLQFAGEMRGWYKNVLMCRSAFSSCHRNPKNSWDGLSISRAVKLHRKEKKISQNGRVVKSKKLQTEGEKDETAQKKQVVSICDRGALLCNKL